MGSSVFSTDNMTDLCVQKRNYNNNISYWSIGLVWSEFSSFSSVLLDSKQIFKNLVTGQDRELVAPECM